MLAAAKQPSLTPKTFDRPAKCSHVHQNGHHHPQPQPQQQQQPTQQLPIQQPPQQLQHQRANGTLAVLAGEDAPDHGKRDGDASTATATSTATAEQQQPLDMRREADRLRSYSSWPVAFLDGARLATTGFYYFGDADRVRCHFCRVELGNWEEGDDPVVDHERWSPLCPLLRGRAFANVPLAASSSASTAATIATDDGSSRDVCGTRERTCEGPQRPAYALESARLQSFADWPCRMKQKPEAMADAGFFYTGSGDKTVCYYCGGGLKDWEDDDDPWEQHARWFPSCRYVRLVKGDEYVRSVDAPPQEKSEPIPNAKGPSAPVARSPPADDSSAQRNTDDSNVCKLCFAGERNVCFVPCGHVVACPKCALSVQKCPVCRKEFTSTMRLYYS